MKNQELAKIFYEIAEFLEMEGVKFKPSAYRKAASTLENLKRHIEEIFEKGGEEAVKNISGVGESIAEKIIEYLKSGEMEYYEKYKKKYPMNIEELTSVEGVGSKMAQELYEQLGVKNLKDLEKAATNGKIRQLPGFGETTEENILEGIKFVRESEGRFLLGNIMPRVEEIEKKIKSLKEVDSINVCGSVRRRKETIGDVDFLVLTRNSSRVMNFFCEMPEVVKVWGQGETKSSIRVKEGFDVDLRIVSRDSYGAALQYFTGSKAHNIGLRKISIERGYKLNEYGVFKDGEKIAGEDEEGVYNELGLQWIPPEIRTNRGEIEAARKGNLPGLVELDEIKGDLHCHSNWDGGKNSIEEMVETAKDKGYRYLGISDHTKFLKIEHGLDESELKAQGKQIEEINKKLKDFQILQGAEVNILKDGSLDIENNSLKKLDYAIAGIHSHFSMSENEMTERIIRAMKNPYINIISHPTGRILKGRRGYPVNLERIFKVAKETGTILEINSYPERLDLNGPAARSAIENGVKLVVNTDSHQKDQLRYMEYGVAQARRGWASSKDIINTYSLPKLKKLLK